ncbi:unnamed protein product [Urochloa decumbens]|uniref:CCHC-type domain-containing protein n=1 Tax=Urochloa decumbens TaxID=240449 RepID=A0ABC8ZTD1_9POAL
MSDPPSERIPRAPPGQLPAVSQPQPHPAAPGNHQPPLSPQPSPNQPQPAPTQPLDLRSSPGRSETGRPEEGEAALDLHYSDSEEDCPASAERSARALTGKGIAQDDKTKASRACGPFPRDPGPSCWGAAGEDSCPAMEDPRPSFKDALLMPRTFKPRFPAVDSQKRQVWYNEQTMGGKARGSPSVWSRLGSSSRIQYPAAGRLSLSNGGSWLGELKAKARDKCYRCLGAGHRIADCRDPPRCILCFRFGHKARRCPHPPSPAPAAHTLLNSARPTQHTLPPAAHHAAKPPPAAAKTAFAAAPSPLQTAARAPPTGDPALLSARSAPSRLPGAAASPAVMDYARWIPGAPEQRPGHVRAGVPRSAAIRDAERDLEIFSLIAVQVDARVRLDTNLVRQEAVCQLRVPSQDLKVSAKAALSTFQYRVRLCIEGVPSHLRHAEAVSSLFKSPAFIDRVDCPMEKPEEEECFRLWLWTSDPDDIATTGTLQVEEPVTLPEDQFSGHWPELGMPLEEVGRVEAAQTMDYDVLIHVDRVLDYTLPPNNPPHIEIDSPVSGHPDEEMEEPWPACHPYTWFLGVPDGGRREPAKHRISVYDRLGDRDRDRSPPGGGGAGGATGLGLKKFPPAGRFELGGSGAQFVHGNCSYQHGGHYRGRQLPSRQAIWRWQIKQGLTLHNTQRDLAELKLVDDSLEAMFAVTQPISEASNAPMIDPMFDEAKSLLIPGPMETKTSDQPIVDGGAADCPIEAPTLAVGGHSTEAEAPGNVLLPIKCTQPMEEVSKPVQPILGSDYTENEHTSPTRVPAVQCPEVLIASPDFMLARLFDLNQVSEEVCEEVNYCNPVPDIPTMQQTMPSQDPNDDRPALGDASYRLNADNTVSTTPRTAPRGPARFAVPLRKSLLCPPVLKNKSSKAKKQAVTDKGPANTTKRIQKDADLRVPMTMDEQATKMLMKTTGILVGDEQLSEEAQQRFGKQFVVHMKEDQVADLRVAFGLPVQGEPDRLSALVAEGDCDDV